MIPAIRGGGMKTSAFTEKESDFLQEHDNTAKLSSFFPVSGQGSFLPTAILTSPFSGPWGLTVSWHCI